MLADLTQKGLEVPELQDCTNETKVEDSVPTWTNKSL